MFEGWKTCHFHTLAVFRSNLWASNMQRSDGKVRWIKLGQKRNWEQIFSYSWRYQRKWDIFFPCSIFETGVLTISTYSFEKNTQIVSSKGRLVHLARWMCLLQRKIWTPGSETRTSNKINPDRSTKSENFEQRLDLLEQIEKPHGLWLHVEDQLEYTEEAGKMGALEGKSASGRPYSYWKIDRVKMLDNWLGYKGEQHAWHRLKKQISELKQISTGKFGWVWKFKCVCGNVIFAGFDFFCKTTNNLSNSGGCMLNALFST